jgi:hypothetical protein
VWWGALLDPGGGGLHERKTGPREYVLLLQGAGEAMAQRMELGTDGLPRRILVVPSPEDSVEYRIVRWRFTPARGRSDFVLETPPGFEVVELPRGRGRAGARGSSSRRRRLTLIGASRNRPLCA